MHKGPTIWPLDKDAFDVADVDHAATDFPDLNFIVEHVGLPRIEDFCFMATQEPNVYAGLSVAIGGLMYARPKFFAKVMGELLFWVGEDKMTFGSDYSIWEPKWQVEGFVDWDYPDDEQFSDYPRVNVNTKKKILGLNAAKLYGIEVPAGLRARGRRRHAGGPGRREAGRRRRCTGVTDAAEVLAALDAVRDPELDEPVTSLGFVASCTVSADGVASVRLRLPTYFCAPNFAYLMVADAYDAVSAVEGVQRADVVLEDHFASDTINAGVAAPARGSCGPSRARRWTSSTGCGRTSCARPCWRAPTGCAGRCSRPASRRTSSPGSPWGRRPPTPDRERLRSRRAELGLPSRGRRAAAGGRRRPVRPSAPRCCRCTWRGPA